MAINRRTLRLLRQLQVAIGGEADQVTRALTRSWVAAWDELATAWRATVDDIIAKAVRDGQWPPPWELARLERLGQALGASEDALAQLGKQAGITVSDGAGQVIGIDRDIEARLVASQLPAAEQAATIARFVGNVLPTALDLIVARTQSQIVSMLAPLSADAMQAMRREFIRGIAVGDNPNTVASRMVARVEGAFNGGLSRAINVARTEMLDAYRTVSRYQHAANADVVAGWVWLSVLDKRTCPACWSMHGRTFPLTQPGPWDHQQGRCARAPKTRSWKELGINVDEPADSIIDAQAKFWKLPEADRLAIMGPRRYDLLRSGRVGWDDLSMQRVTPGWRPSYTPRTVADLERIAANRQAQGIAPSPFVPANPRAAARARQAEIDRVRTLAEAAADLEQRIIDGEADMAVLRATLSTWTKRGKSVAPLRDAARRINNAEDLLPVIDDVAAANRLARIERAGQTVDFDRKAHKAIGGDFDPGDRVFVVRPGYRYLHAADDEVLLFKAIVEEADVLPVSIRVAAKGNQAAYVVSNADRLRGMYGWGSIDEGLTHLAARQGFGKLPQVVSAADLDRAIARGWTEVWRGVNSIGSKTAADIADEVRSGPWKLGSGIYGNGFYTSVRRFTAEQYRGRDIIRHVAGDDGDYLLSNLSRLIPDQRGGLMRMAIDPDAKIINWIDLRAEQKAWLASSELEDLLRSVPREVARHTGTLVADLGFFATMRGYDVVRIVGLGDGADYPVGRLAADQFLVLNRSVLMVLRGGVIEVNVTLSRRLAHAFLAGEASVAERDQLVAAAQGATTVNDLSESARQLLRDLERRGRARKREQTKR